LASLSRSLRLRYLRVAVAFAEKQASATHGQWSKAISQMVLRPNSILK